MMRSRAILNLNSTYKSLSRKDYKSQFQPRFQKKQSRIQRSILNLQVRVPSRMDSQLETRIEESQMFGQFPLLPKQTVLAFTAKPKKSDTSSWDPVSEPPQSPEPNPKRQKSSLDIIQGGSSVQSNMSSKDDTTFSGSEYEARLKIANEYIKLNSIPEPEAKKIRWMELARHTMYDKKTEEEFFSQNGLVRNIGITTPVRVRVGYCSFTNSWKLYVCKKNANVDASVVTVSLAEVSDIVENIGAKIEEIQDGIKQKSHSIAQKIQERTFRVRFIWQPINVYVCYINEIRKLKDYPNYFGPRIRLTLPESVKFVDALKRFMDGIPLQENIFGQ